MNLSKNVKVLLAKAAAAAATTDVETDIIDIQGFEGVMLVGSIGTANAGNYVKAQQGNDSGLSDAADLEGTKIVPGDDGDSFLLDLYRPQKRYIKGIVTRGVSTTTGDIYALLYVPAKAPVSHGATIDAELHVSPDEGTA